MKANFEEVNTDEQIEELARLARDIWFEYWPHIIGVEQTAYMVESFQSSKAIKRDIENEGYRYWFMLDENGKKLGYTGGHVDGDRFFISKIYLLSAERGHGYGSQAIAFYVDLCRRSGLRAAYLTVNKHNDLAIRAYRAKGFRQIDAVETDIGQGFVMDDYIMELAV